MNLDNSLKDKLSEISTKLNLEASKITKVGEKDFLLLALRGLINYAKLVYNRLEKNDVMPIESIAISARNLFECYLLVAYMMKDPSKAKEFLSQKAFDEREINEGFLSLTTSNTPKEVMRQIQERMDHIEMLMKNSGLTPSKHWTVSHLAIATDNKLEYDVFFKLYSKYTHPSSWMVNSHDFEVDNPVFRTIFLSQIQIFSKRIIKTINSYIEK